MRLLYLLIPLVSACSPELTIHTAKQCKGATRQKGITIFKAYPHGKQKYPAGCSTQQRNGVTIAQFVKGDSTTPCSTTAQPTPYECICKGLPDIRHTLVNKHRKL